MNNIAKNNDFENNLREILRSEDSSPVNNQTGNTLDSGVRKELHSPTVENTRNPSPLIETIIRIAAGILAVIFLLLFGIQIANR